jgi:HSP20 family protein
MLIFRFSRISGRFEIVGAGTVEGPKTAFRPAIDVSYFDQAFTVRMDIPGVTPEDMSIEAGDNEISISGSVPSIEQPGPWRLMERRSGPFRRTISFPSRIASDKIEAHLNNGVLTLKIPTPDLKHDPITIDIRIEGAD